MHVTLSQPITNDFDPWIHTIMPGLISDCEAYLKSQGEEVELREVTFINEDPRDAILSTAVGHEIKVGLLVQTFLVTVLKFQLFSASTDSDSNGENIAMIYTFIQPNN
jgi:hypothetical protein